MLDLKGLALTNVFGAKSKQSQKTVGAKPYKCKADTIRQPQVVRLANVSLWAKRQPVPASLVQYFAKPVKVKMPAWRVKQLKEAKRAGRSANK